MNEITILRRAYRETVRLIKREREVNEKAIELHGKEDVLAVKNIQKYFKQKNYIRDRIAELEK